MWQEPKTDWISTDNFNIEDYNRIINNIKVLYSLVNELYDQFVETDLGNEKTYDSYIYADEINAIEQSLTDICAHVYPFEIGEQMTYYPNRPATDWKEFNRIESACLKMYENLSGQSSGRRRLAFILNGGAF